MTKWKTNSTSTVISINQCRMTYRALGRPGAGAAVDFVELLGRSNFSFLQGASHPEEMALTAKSLGYRGLGMCDLNGLYGVVRAHQVIFQPSHFNQEEQIENHDFRFHPGAEMQLQDKTSLALLPMNKEGYIRLCQLITLARRPSEKGFSCLHLNAVLEHSEDLIALALPPWDAPTLKKLLAVFHDRLYLAAWKDYTWDSIRIYNQARELEESLHIPIIATQRPVMHHRQRKALWDVLTCILHGTTLREAKTRLAANSERHLKPLPELALLWQDRPDCLTRTLEISKRLEFSLNELRYDYPQATLPPGKNSDEYLRELTMAGLKRRFPQGIPAKILQTAEHELNIIRDMAYEDYFLTLLDVCQFAEKQGILYQGRGSAANSIVCYAIGLTAVDPSKIDLLFERFISKERGEPPDIDIDFENERREEVIQYIYQKYGYDHAAMVCTVICYRSKMALRECGKVFGLKLDAINAMIKFMGREGLRHLHEHLDKAEGWGLKASQLQQLIEAARTLVSFPRHLSIHTGGFVIARRPVTECVPIERATMDKRYVIQWNKDDINTLKLMKIDVLALGMLTALQKCFAMLRKEKNIDWDLSKIPPEDPATYAMIQKADTIGVFQIESRAQMSMLPRFKPANFYDIVVEVAIIRPGPLQGGMVHPYIKRRKGLEAVTYPHPDLIPILKRTYGVPIFQEQIMQMAVSVCGFTPGEADELRRIMSSSWKKPEAMKGLRTRLINGMLHKQIKQEYAEQIYQTIVGFASYGFPESHAASFALLTYASCYLKWHHPEVFTCALLNSQPMGFYSPRALIADAQRHKVRFLPLHLQKSNYDYSLEKIVEGDSSTRFAIRPGFRALYGLKEQHIRHMLEEREKNGSFLDLTDLVRRTHLPKAVLLNLAASGALNCLGLEPRQALWQIQGLELKNQSLLFGMPKENFHKISEDQDYLPAEEGWEKMNREYRSYGYSLVRHPLGLLREGLAAKARSQKDAPPFTRAKDLGNLPNGKIVRVAGLSALQQRPPTAKGFCFITLEDETGNFNIVLKPPVFQAHRILLSEQPLLEITGKLEKADGVLNIKADRLFALQVDRLLQMAPPKTKAPKFLGSGAQEINSRGQ